MVTTEMMPMNSEPNNGFWFSWVVYYLNIGQGVKDTCLQKRAQMAGRMREIFFGCSLLISLNRLMSRVTRN